MKHPFNDGSEIRSAERFVHIVECECAVKVLVRGDDQRATVRIDPSKPGDDEAQRLPQDQDNATVVYPAVSAQFCLSQMLVVGIIHVMLLHTYIQCLTSRTPGFRVSKLKYCISCSKIGLSSSDSVGLRSCPSSPILWVISNV